MWDSTAAAAVWLYTGHTPRAYTCEAKPPESNKNFFHMKLNKIFKSTKLCIHTQE